MHKTVVGRSVEKSNQNFTLTENEAKSLWALSECSTSHLSNIKRRESAAKSSWMMREGMQLSCWAEYVPRQKHSFSLASWLGCFNIPKEIIKWKICQNSVCTQFPLKSFPPELPFTCSTIRTACKVCLFAVGEEFERAKHFVVLAFDGETANGTSSKQHKFLPNL